jgi:hypothetical protein
MAQEWLESIFDPAFLFDEVHGFTSQDFVQVEEALRAEVIEQGHVIGDPNESALNLARAAGYLIGVQVGLRLRSTEARFAGRPLPQVTSESAK